ncbi:MAG TPA: L,D-transpeptidase family protein [Sphingomicrobium sp.]|nr:L,D-transpeptidase family protein [Sphingomicrobium sp.]
MRGFRYLTAAAMGLAAPVLASGWTAAVAAQPESAAGSVADFYRSRGNAPLWFGDQSGIAARQLLQLIATSQVEGLNPKRYNVRGLSRAVEAAARNPAERQRAERMLSEAFVAYVHDSIRDPNIGIVYVDRELVPSAPSPRQILAAAAAAPSLSNYVGKIGWMNPIYGELRQAIASRMYRDGREARLLSLNLERARALPSGGHRYIIVNAAAQRLYMYEDGQVVDSMRVVAGKPESQTPMMNALIRYVALNPYWNVPPETASHNLAPKILKEGRSYFTNRGYDVFDGWGDSARKIDPMTINWRAVAAGQLQVKMRQRPGPANSMGKMKFMFPNKEGIWLHDTPVQERIDDPARLQSGGCVRLEDAARLQRWIYGKTLKPKGNAPEQKVSVPGKMPVYLTYLTAVPSGTSIVYFDDFYGRDRAQPRRRG